MTEDSQLDLTSEPFATSAKDLRSVNAQPQSTKHPQSSMRMLFNCCRVYAVVRVPTGVLNGQLTHWRFHCPRCGSLVDIPLDS